MHHKGRMNRSREHLRPRLLSRVSRASAAGPERQPRHRSADLSCPPPQDDPQCISYRCAGNIAELEPARFTTTALRASSCFADVYVP